MSRADRADVPCDGDTEPKAKRVLLCKDRGSCGVQSKGRGDGAVRKDHAKALSGEGQASQKESRAEEGVQTEQKK